MITEICQVTFECECGQRLVTRSSYETVVACVNCHRLHRLWTAQAGNELIPKEERLRRFTIEPKPYISIVNGPGFSGRWVAQWMRHPWYSVIESTPISRSVWDAEGHQKTYRSSFGGTKFGWRGHNYWISDDTVLGFPFWLTWMAYKWLKRFRQFLIPRMA